MRKIVRNVLSELGFTDIVEAKHGKDAWEKIIANLDIPGKKIELGIIDWNMPVMTGLQLLKKIRADDKTSDLIFLMLTAEKERDNIVAAVQSGVDEYMVKPFNSGTLQGKLLNIARKKLAAVEKEIDQYFGASDSDLNIDDSESDKKGKMAEFKRRIHKVSEIVPWSGVGHFTLGKMLFKFKDYQQAEIFSRKAVSLDFGNAETHSLLSKILRVTGKIPESAKELRIAVAERPKSGELKQKLGDAYLHEGKYELAIQELEASLKLLDQKNVKLLAKGMNSMGKAKMDKGEAKSDESLKKEAVGDMENAVKIDPDLISAHYDLMVAYKKTGRTKEALSIYQFLQSAEPKDADGWVALGKAFLERSEPKKAMFAFDKADKTSMGRFGIYEEIATELIRSGDYKNAVKFIDKAREINPSDINTYNLKGIVYRRQDLYSKAVKEYICASELNPDDAGVFFNLGVAYFKSGKKGKSIIPFTKAKELDPNLAEADHYLKLMKS